ncbi:hypothetical protein TRFO_08839 [Tritrichomonas foetus]|uniref:ubiquitinyl hydrolase 1 n=1 Tax=Tritrichomonas foetus TaxID=1144522 RepID=A0A1J4JLZ9_9EUKA|nr:hypothetical protein TRFO_08839 [Tritrichomonas foetus]|eukprot:OHS98557.1 hypothetical protein TRFO_08839 [Tritrichomonas foetus]
MESCDQTTSAHVYACLGFRKPYESNTRSTTLNMTTRELVQSTRRLREEAMNQSNQTPQAGARTRSLARRLNNDAGIANSHNCCFMNSFLQVLFHLPQFMNDLAEAVDKIDMSYYSLLRETLRLFFEYRTAQEPIQLRKFYSVLTKYAPPLGDNRQHDVVEFILRYIEQCQIELAPYIASPQSMDIFSKSLMLKHDPFMKNFGLTLATRVKCPSCGDHDGPLSTHYLLHVPFVESTLEKNVALFFRTERCNCTCDKCQCNSARVQYSIYRLPRYMLIQLDRFDPTNRKNNKAISYPTEIDFNLYANTGFFTPPLKFTNKSKFPEEYPLSNNETQTTPNMNFNVDEDEDLGRRPPVALSKFQLASVILHEGDFDNGHYKAATSAAGRWTVFDNSEVYSNGNFDKSSPYVFVYEKVSADY